MDDAFQLLGVPRSITLDQLQEVFARKVAPSMDPRVNEAFKQVAMYVASQSNGAPTRSGASSADSDFTYRHDPSIPSIAPPTKSMPGPEVMHLPPIGGRRTLPAPTHPGTPMPGMPQTPQELERERARVDAERGQIPNLFGGAAGFNNTIFQNLFAMHNPTEMKGPKVPAAMGAPGSSLSITELTQDGFGTTQTSHGVSLKDAFRGSHNPTRKDPRMLEEARRRPDPTRVSAMSASDMKSRMAQRGAPLEYNRDRLTTDLNTPIHNPYGLHPKASHSIGASTRGYDRFGGPPDLSSRTGKLTHDEIQRRVAELTADPMASPSPHMTAPSPAMTAPPMTAPNPYAPAPPMTAPNPYAPAPPMTTPTMTAPNPYASSNPYPYNSTPETPGGRVGEEESYVRHLERMVQQQNRLLRQQRRSRRHQSRRAPRPTPGYFS